MAIKFKCHCGRVLQARDERAGTRGKCPACGASVAVPEVVLAEIAETQQQKAVCDRCKKEVPKSELGPTLGFNVCKACGIAIEHGTVTPVSNGPASRSEVVEGLAAIPTPRAVTPVPDGSRESHFASTPMPERTRAAARIKPGAIACVSIADVQQKYWWLFIPVLSWLGLVFPLVLPPIPLGPIEVSVAWNRRDWMSHITRSLSALGKKRKTYGFPLGWCVNAFINLVDMATLGLSHLFVTARLHDELAKKARINEPHGDFSAVTWVSKWLIMGNVVFVVVYVACPGLLFRRILLSMEEHLRTLEFQAGKEEPIVAQVAQGADVPSSSQIAPDATALGRVVPAASGSQGIEGKTDPHVHDGYPADVVNLTIKFPGKRMIANMGLPMLFDGVEIGTLRARSGCEVQVRTGLRAHCLHFKTWLDKHRAHPSVSKTWELRGPVGVQPMVRQVHGGKSQLQGWGKRS